MTTPPALRVRPLTVRDLYTALGELIEAGKGDLPVATDGCYTSSPDVYAVLDAGDEIHLTGSESAR